MLLGLWFQIYVYLRISPTILIVVDLYSISLESLLPPCLPIWCYPLSIGSNFHITKSVLLMVCWSVGLSAIVSYKGGKFHCHVPIGSLVYFCSYPLFSSLYPFVSMYILALSPATFWCCCCCCIPDGSFVERFSSPAIVLLDWCQRPEKALHILSSRDTASI